VGRVARVGWSGACVGGRVAGDARVHSK